MTTDTNAELRLISNNGDRPPLTTTGQSVPLLWLGVFDYDDTEVQRDDTLEVFSAATSVMQARQRARVLHSAITGQHPALISASQILVSALANAPADADLVLSTEKILSEMPSATALAYIQQLVNCCDLFEQLRKGLPWPVVQQHLERIHPSFPSLLHQGDAEAARLGLVGLRASTRDSLEERLVSKGQDQDDLRPEALAVGNQGLLLGRFNGVWKLMSSGTDQDLKGVWGLEDTAFLVGSAGTVIKLDQGQCTAMEVPSDRNLNAVWGLSPRMVCVVGEEGAVLMFTGRSWQKWVVPSEAALHTIAGSGPENICIAGREPTVLVFDGYSWDRVDLPEDSVANQLCCVNGVVLAAGKAQRGGEISRLEEGAFVKDALLPKTNPLEGIWAGWENSFGVVPTTGVSLFHNGSGWVSEPLPAEWIHASAGGAMAMAVGRSGKYSVLLARVESEWQVEASLKGQRLNTIWVAGSPKPPRLTIPPQPEGDAEADHA